MIEKLLYYKDTYYNEYSIDTLLENVEIKDIKAIFKLNKNLNIIRPNFIEAWNIILPNNFRWETKVFCDGCGIEITQKDIDPTKKVYCETCLKNSTRCSQCGEIIEPSELKYSKCKTNSGNIAHLCYHCRRLHTIGKCMNWKCACKFLVTNNKYLCCDCEKEFNYCKVCDELFRKRDMEFKDGICINCYSKKLKKESLKEYSYKPSPNFKKSSCENEDHKEYMGIELEFENNDIVLDDDKRETTYKIFEKYKDFLYIKSDSSLSFGFEVVTHPITLKSWLNEYLEKIKDTISIANADSFYSNSENTGLHVHFSREALGKNILERQTTIIKLVTLFSNTINKDFIIKFTRRDEKKLEKWANFYNLKALNITENLDLGNQDDILNIVELLSHESRYKNINLKNKNTIEFRIFKGTDDIEDIKASLILLYNSIAYCIRNTYQDVYHTTFKEILEKGYYKEFMLDYLRRKEI